MGSSWGGLCQQQGGAGRGRQVRGDHHPHVQGDRLQLHQAPQPVQPRDPRRGEILFVSFLTDLVNFGAERLIELGGDRRVINEQNIKEKFWDIF